MNFIDHSRWDYNDSTYAIDDIKMLANHFSTMLIHTDFKLDAVIFEFHQLKELVKSRYQHFSHSTSLLTTVAYKHHDQYRHILFLVEIILSMEWASSTVERGFSTVNCMLPNSRLNPSKNHLNNLLMLRINVPILSKLDPEYEAKLIDMAVSEYLNKQCYVTKSKKTAQVKPHEYDTSSEDLFLLTLRKPNLTSDLLKDENYLQISDDESVQEMSDSDNDSDNSKEGEEIDLNID